MAVAIEGARESYSVTVVTINITYRCPFIQAGCVCAPVTPSVGVVQPDVVGELEIFARIIGSAVHVLRQLCQLRAVADKVRGALRATSAAERRGHGAVPYFITCLRPQRGARHKEERQHGEPQDSHCFSCLCFLSHLFFI